MAARDVVLIGVMVFALATALFVTNFASREVTSRMMGISAINQSDAAMEALAGSEAVTDRMDYVVFGVFIGLVLALLITGFLIGGNPIFMFIYFIVVVISVVLSTVLANVWEEITQQAIFGTTVSSFPISNNLMLNLPIYMAVVGFFGMVIMFAKPYIFDGGVH